jgi:DNA-binding NtrC family response regulator
MPLARVFLAEASKAMGRAAPLVIAEDAEELLMAYAWPGNVRELKNVMERAAILCLGGEITCDHLAAESMELNASFAAPEARLAVPAAASEGMSEKDRILHALHVCVWNQSRAAKLLNMSRTRFVQKLAEYDIPRPRK